MIRSTHEGDRFGDSIGHGANDESTRSQREYSVDASGMQMRIYHAEQKEGRHVTLESVQCQEQV